MPILRTRNPIHWGHLDVPIFGIQRDWHGAEIVPPVGWCLVADPEALWLLATRGASGKPQPASSTGEFVEGLWNHEVAELFIADPARERYLECNLAPNGAWWACQFDSPRVRSEEQPDFPAIFRSHADPDAAGSWTAGLRLPLDFLQKSLNFGPSSPLNVTFILHDPAPRYLSLADLGSGEPDFHRPWAFPVVSWMDVDSPSAP
ncbi:hypothetical protein HNR46_003168 [Haloferula luteola]|uniref:Carbohydrate-binding domain-containing protein n=1 Tax=Haloferula luteola TaxID=595692 RepID=A0A840VGH0_9BACT|nr:hypothetical protein [Haloferula luteola]MBB5352919.1 hypothetical protein [Haloferula luteola]